MSRTRHIGSEKIIEAAKDVLSRGGPEALTIRSVAESADVTKGTVYYYFNAKEDLVNAVIRSSVDEQFEQFDEAFQGAGSNLEGIEKTLDAIREVFLKDDVFHRRFFGLVAKGFVDESSAREMRLLMDKIGYKIEKCLAEVMGDTREFIVPLNHFSRILRAMFDGLALQVLVDPDFDIDATFESVKKIILALYSEHVRQWPATQR
jgi:AcrR family transcriptional regulator